MKKVLLFACFFFLVGLAITACNKTATFDDEKQIVSLYSCKQQVNGLPETRICFDSLVADARCPKNVQCIWEGYAIIKVSFQENGNIHSFKMSLWGTPFVTQQFKAVHDTTINGYKIVFTALSETNRPPSDMEAVFDVSR